MERKRKAFTFDPNPPKRFRFNASEVVNPKPNPETSKKRQYDDQNDNKRVVRHKAVDAEHDRYIPRRAMLGNPPVNFDSGMRIIPHSESEERRREQRAKAAEARMRLHAADDGVSGFTDDFKKLVLGGGAERRSVRRAQRDVRRAVRRLLRRAGRQ